MKLWLTSEDIGRRDLAVKTERRKTAGEDRNENLTVDYGQILKRKEKK